jgi:thiamine-monophosphate kinase
MSQSEFAIIDRYFKSIAESAADVALGPGDDCAVLDVPTGYQICISTDSLLQGVHFPENAPASVAATRTMGANLSDIAAMGADPHSFLLALTMPSVDEAWLEEFSSTLKSLISLYKVPLVGGNISRGPLSLTMTILGKLPTGTAVERGGAKVGDDIYVTGTLGDAARGLELFQAGDRESYLAKRYMAPRPRLREGSLVRSLATSMIDISDGLVADLGHICEMSGVGAGIHVSEVPLSAELVEAAGEESATRLALFAGDDYELCFTADRRSSAKIEGLAREAKVPITKIGTVIEGENVLVLDQNNQPLSFGGPGYQHF